MNASFCVGTPSVARLLGQCKQTAAVREGADGTPCYLRSSFAAAYGLQTQPRPQLANSQPSARSAGQQAYRCSRRNVASIPQSLPCGDYTTQLCCAVCCDV